MRAYRHPWLRRCAACQTLKAALAIDIPTTPAEAGVDEAQREAGLGALRNRNNRTLLSALEALVPRGARLLDVGCGPGFLLGLARDDGLRAEGLEPDANVVQAARSAGVQVREGFFPDALAAGEQFDVIVFNDVLEHIPDLRGALEASWRHLRPGGVLCLNCPSRHGLFFRTAAALDRLGLHGPYDRLWQRELSSPHVWYFTPETLHRAAGRAGFAPIRDVRLETVEMEGLWARIRCVRDQSLPISLAAYAFTIATFPLSRTLPSDAVACFFRKPEAS
jgi:SAM-dependent methyltransferase